MTELILTKAERMRMHEDQRIAAEFREIKQAHPSVAPFRIIATIAASGNFKSKSVAGIRSALIRTGTITPKSRS